MKYSAKIVVRQQILRFIFPAIILFAAASAFAQVFQTTAEKPQAVLVGVWNEPSELVIGKIMIPRTLKRARIVSKHNTPVTPPSVPAITVSAVSYKFAGRFKNLRPTPLEENAFQLINQKRSAQNLPILEWDLEMLYLAREHSQSMAKNNFFSHTGLDGKTTDDRANQIGITDWRAIGENIALNQGLKNSVDFAVQCWMASPRHKDNLLGKKWTRTGVGVAVSPDGKFYITQVFRN